LTFSELFSISAADKKKNKNLRGNVSKMTRGQLRGRETKKKGEREGIKRHVKREKETGQERLN
jgi:hypothetical protein